MSGDDICICDDCGYRWNPIYTEHLNFTCCESCGHDKITMKYIYYPEPDKKLHLSKKISMIFKKLSQFLRGLYQKVGDNLYYSKK